jgi:hypothetical protein
LKLRLALIQRLGLGLLCALGSACTEFPTIAASGCGNHVIEGKEDCDGFPTDKGTVCLPPGSAFECHFDCSFGDNGKQIPCPNGWGCDADFVCRAPTNSFTESSLSPDVGAWSLTAGDFDGDGRHDVVSAEPLDAQGATRLRFNYFDAQGALSETRLFPKTLLSPSIHLISKDDAVSDVAFTVGPIGVMKGRSDRTWVPEVFSSYRRDNASVRIVGVYHQAVGFSAAFTTLISSADGENGFYLGNPDTGKLEIRVSVPGSIDQLVGDLVSGSVFEDTKHSPCLEPVFAMRGDTHFSVVDTCDTDEKGTVIWRPTFTLTEIELVPPAPIDAPPQLVDMNNDKHLDVLLGAGGRPYVAYGDGQALASAVPYIYPDPNVFPAGTPLAVGDFSDDEVLDFVFPDRLLASIKAYPGAVPVYVELPNRHTSPWTAAIIADFNSNGKPDVVTASSGSLNIDFFNAIGPGFLSGSLISTSAPVQFMTAGDFDSDLTTDLAFSEVPPVDGEPKGTLKVAFGNAFSLPGSPVNIGQVERIESVNSFRDAGRDNLAVCSNEIIGSMQNGALTLLSGGPDRVPFAPLALTEFSSNRNVQDAGSLAVVSGHFVNLDQAGVLALAFFSPRPGERVTPPINVWSVPAITEPGAVSLRLPGQLDSRLNPFQINFDDGSVSADVASAAEDLDGDQLDEGIFAMPADGGAHCGILVIGADSRGELGSASQKPIIIDEPCADPQIQAVRFLALEPKTKEEAEENPFHLALLTGKSDADNRHLYVLWNDGHGQFSGQNITLISAQDSPQGFTVLPLDRASNGLVYITKNAMSLVRAPIARDFPTPDVVPGGVPVKNGTGIVAADVNGDHLSDLVFSESGQLRVLKAGLVVQ